MQANLKYENSLWEKGFVYVCGVDEAGRGPLAGPVVAAAVIFDKTYRNTEINDSKQLSKLKRERLRDVILKEALYIGIGIVDENIIDQINILEASRLAMFEAIKNLGITPDFILSDCMDLSPLPHMSLIKGDSLSLSIAAASIIAKTKRDEIMKMYDALYPMYGFSKHQGYGTKLHLEALDLYGVTPIHRKSYQPIKIRMKKWPWEIMVLFSFITIKVNCLLYKYII